MSPTDEWYRNEQEFYRFVPNDRPKLQIFPQDGIRVEVSQVQILVLKLIRSDKTLFLAANSNSSNSCI